MIDNLLQFFGRFHPLLVHLPIGFLILAAVFEWLARKEKYANLNPAVGFSLFWGMISAVIACAMGYALSLGGDYNPDTLAIHQYLGIGTAIFALLAWLLKRGSLSFLAKTQRLVPVFMLLLLSATGHYGGSLTHGSEYLTQPALALMGLAPAVAMANDNEKAKPIANINEAKVYQEVIQPIMKQKCWQCHNADKQKGQLRMDELALLQKGGKHGVIFKAGDVASSEMYKRLLLPESDEYHMPPKGKNQLSEEEIALVEWWIAEGANFDKKVKDLKQNEKVKPFFAALSGGDTGSEKAIPSIPDVPKESISAASNSDIENLKKLNALVMSVSSESPYLMANFVNAPDFNDANASSISALGKNLVWLRLGSTKITDKALVEVAKLPNLSRLNLEHTAITDDGLAQLSGLKNLQYLNLFDTKVSDKGLMALAKCTNLRNLYLYQTKATPAIVAALQKALPYLKVDIGGYMTAALTSDTVIYKAEPKKEEAKKKK